MRLRLARPAGPWPAAGIELLLFTSVQLRMPARATSCPKLERNRASDRIDPTYRMEVILYCNGGIGTGAKFEFP